jgi:hypothetical protein
MSVKVAKFPMYKNIYIEKFKKISRRYCWWCDVPKDDLNGDDGQADQGHSEELGPVLAVQMVQRTRWNLSNTES